MQRITQVCIQHRLVAKRKPKPHSFLHGQSARKLEFNDNGFDMNDNEVRVYPQNTGTYIYGKGQIHVGGEAEWEVKMKSLERAQKAAVYRSQ